jgi:hypothetical protein
MGAIDSADLTDAATITDETRGGLKIMVISRCPSS